MAATKYTYSISADFPDHKVSPDRLTNEIRQSAIVVALDYIETLGDECDIWFKEALSPGDELILDGIVATHSGEPLPVPSNAVVLESPHGGDVSVEDDGKLVVVNFPADEGSYMWLTGAGDDVVNDVRGGGARMVFEFDDLVRAVPETKTVDLHFMEWVQLHDGQMTLPKPSDWDVNDVWDFCIHMEATAVTPNPGGTGNCNLVNPAGDPGQPDSYIIIPSYGGPGAYDVDLDTAVPVPAGGEGYWDYNYETNVLDVSSSPGAASWHLLAVTVDSYFMRNIVVPLHPAGNFDFDAYKAERIMPRRWALRLTVTKASDGPGKLTGWIVTFREQNT
jgi:hypothetical protein